MSVLEKFFSKKAQDKNEKLDLYQPVSSLFQAYLINTCSKSVSEGNSPYSVNFTSMAKTAQPYTFSQFCAYISQGYNVASEGNYNLEKMQLEGAKNIINNPNYAQGTFKNIGRETSLVEACNMVSKVYEMSLATSARFQQTSQNPEELELSYSALTGLQNNLYASQEKAFTSQPFDRQQPDYSTVRTIENPREEFINICNNGDVNFVYESLNLIVETTARAQSTMSVMHKDFEVPQAPAVE